MAAPASVQGAQVYYTRTAMDETIDMLAEECAALAFFRGLSDKLPFSAAAAWQETSDLDAVVDEELLDRLCMAYPECIDPGCDSWCWLGNKCVRLVPVVDPWEGMEQSS